MTMSQSCLSRASFMASWVSTCSNTGSNSARRSFLRTSWASNTESSTISMRRGIPTRLHTPNVWVLVQDRPVQSQLPHCLDELSKIHGQVGCGAIGRLQPRRQPIEGKGTRDVGCPSSGLPIASPPVPQPSEESAIKIHGNFIILATGNPVPCGSDCRSRKMIETEPAGDTAVCPMPRIPVQSLALAAFRIVPAPRRSSPSNQSRMVRTIGGWPSSD